jgi:hypothetical protein
MRTFPIRLRFWTALFVVMWMCVLDLGPAMAGLAPSHTSGATTIATARDADMLLAQRALENKVVAQKLRDYGVAPEDARLKLANMSDRDLHTLASASKGLPSGGDDFGSLIGLLIVVLLVIVILKLMHHEVVIR